jgi:hypothetical protein
MQETNQAIANIQQQIAELNRELERLQRRSNSLWGSIFNAFIEEGNDEEVAELWSNRLSKMVGDWVSTKRGDLGQRLVSTGEMPPYTDCLNDLLVAMAPAGSSPPPAESGLTGPSLEFTSLVAPVPQGLPSDVAAGPPKMQRVNVPKPFAQMA